MPQLKLMMSPGYKVFIGDDIEIEVLMVGERRTQLAVRAPVEIPITRIPTRDEERAERALQRFDKEKIIVHGGPPRPPLITAMRSALATGLTKRRLSRKPNG